MDYFLCCHRQIIQAVKGLLVLFVFAVLTPQELAAQFNPVKNLHWEHWYICPYNYFDLSWEQPDSTMDTLVGYNVYREQDLYRFQVETSLNHTPAASNCSEDFLWYNGGESFWMHVTAVYNATLQESGYIDSAYCYGLAVEIIEHVSHEYKIYPNPFTTSTTIDFELKGNSKIQISIYNAMGALVYQFQSPGHPVSPSPRHKITWSPGHLPAGLYYGVLRSKEGVSVVKMIKQ